MIRTEEATIRKLSKHAAKINDSYNTFGYTIGKIIQITLDFMAKNGFSPKKWYEKTRGKSAIRPIPTKFTP